MSCFYDMREDETQTSSQRAFNHDVKDEELVWHRDENDRIVKVISGVNWKFQFDNELPMTMVVGKSFKIPKMTYHRIIKGEGRLILEIKEI